MAKPVCAYCASMRTWLQISNASVKWAMATCICKPHTGKRLTQEEADGLIGPPGETNWLAPDSIGNPVSKMGWRIINEDTECQPLCSTYMYIHRYTHTWIYKVHILPQITIAKWLLLKATL